jgi:molybdate/tungstate transport system permease protein
VAPDARDGVGGVALTVVGPNTLVGRLAAAGGVPLTRSLAGVVLAQTFVASPFVVVTAKAAFESVDRSLEHAARTLGEGRVATFRRVTLPLAWPGVVAGVTLAFARAMGEFGATIMLAYYPRTPPSRSYSYV